ncbi:MULTISPECIES: tetratricopeptide repeat protein [unclassified Colwellia]|uniref:tetratricopeptide repeat protein n=1 Tax=unclassified Colwellia TaxID=196834 RepID=UPI0015F65516|nr:MULTISPECIES: tetratricopeptide repeat protein [unclassified Colwellia]MBA6233993.1 tetratricopeptide repeat protein [Colwellia sp. MB02u-7]MBA6236943.1 tetratricopeptide repeat protein [Colwellia sp. MB02u-11]MBA6256114.1 tetratricopeptide repeat protein [Colwellia sp. MB3u-28]MBA6259345.1 tetratricopeptide repeat protein [Colwellia sp. MB3u-41]MBA6300667.1 tetratricopeptide repeat protein [Colwellia sp. MB3u-22]
MNTQYYPLSAKAWDSLGEAYLVKGEKERALSLYKKSFELNPNNNNANEKIKLLNSD